MSGAPAEGGQQQEAAWDAQREDWSRGVWQGRGSRAPHPPHTEYPSTGNHAAQDFLGKQVTLSPGGTPGPSSGLRVHEEAVRGSSPQEGAVPLMLPG